MKQITSAQNPLVKSLVQLREKSRERRQSGTFLMEGKREVHLAVEGGYEIDSILFVPAMMSREELAYFESLNAEVIEINEDVYQRLAYRDTTEGIIAIGKSKNHGLDNLELGSKPLILIAEAPEKPGNIGALLRTADAAGLDAVIIANPNGDLYNPNVIRSSVGCIFTVQIGVGSSSEIIDYLAKRNIAVYCAALQDSVPYHLEDFTAATAMVVGTESTGLSEEWRQAAKRNIIIPMHGKIDSMNVSVAAAILIFEAKRQRGFQ